MFLFYLLRANRSYKTAVGTIQQDVFASNERDLVVTFGNRLLTLSFVGHAIGHQSFEPSIVPQLSLEFC